MSSLTTPQVRMILRIYWTDRYQRQLLGFNRSTHGLRGRLAKQFDVSIEVIKKLIGIKHNQHNKRGMQRRARFKTIALKSIQRSVQIRLRQRGVPVAKDAPGRPRRREKIAP